MRKISLLILAIIIMMLSGCGLITPSKANTRIELDKTRVEIKIGESILIKATTSDEKEVSWRCDDIKIATVDSGGRVTGISAGTTTVVAFVGKEEASCKVIVKGNTDNITTTTKNDSPLTTTKNSITTTKTDSSTTTTTKQGDDQVDNIDYSEILFDYYRDGTLKRVSRETILGSLTHVNSCYYDIGYVNKLEEPSKDVLEKSQLVDILDYMAFYHINEFEIDIKYQTQNIKQDIIDSFWNTYFCPGTVGVTYKESKIKMLFNEEANSFYEPAEDNIRPGIPYSFSSSIGKRSNDFDNFNYKNNSNGEIDVYNSDQLIYVLEKGYLPKIIEGSPAELIYNKATSILRAIIYDDMTEKDKGLAISSYILAHVNYDFSADELAASTSSELVDYPDFIASNMCGFYAEGPLFYNQAVCHGYAKAFALLALIEGLDITKVSAPYRESLNPDGSKNLSSITYTYDDFGNIVGATFSSHGYNYVLDKDDNKYYICDPTYSFATYGSLRNFNEEKYSQDYVILPRSLALFKAFSDWKMVYKETAEDYFAIENSSNLGETSFNWANSFKMKVGHTTIDLFIESDDELNTFNSNIVAYLSDYNDQSYKNEKSDILCIMVFATDEMLEKTKDEITLFGWRGVYGNSDMGYIFIFEK